MAAPQGLISFPGVEQILGGSLTRSQGIAPWICMIQMAPQDQILKTIGELQITFGRVKLSFPDSQIDLGSVERSRGGQIVSLRILTRQWKWQFGSIDGLYNDRTNNGALVKVLEKSPRELAELLFRAMGERSYDVAALDSLPRPKMDWVGANPANEMANLGDSLGCRVVVNLKNRAKIVRVGVGQSLPDSDVMAEGVGLNPASRPDIIRLIGGPDVFQTALLLEAVGEENDDYGTLKPIDELSYMPTDGWGKESPQGFWGVAPGESADTKEKCRQLALKTVYRLYRIKSQLDGTWKIPQVVWLAPDAENVEVTDRRQIVLLPSQIVKVYPKAEDDPIRFKPAVISGSYYPESWSTNNTDLGTVYDGQFSIDAEPRRQLVEFSKPVYKFESVPDDPTLPDGAAHTEYAPADLRLETSYNILHKDTRQLIRSTKEIRLSGVAAGNPLVMPVVYDDVFRSYRATYKAIRQFQVNPLTGVDQLTTIDVKLKAIVDNRTEFEESANHYLQSRIRQFENVVSSEREYAGIRDDIDLDGAISQITYTVGRSGATTRVSRNSEHDYDIPSYEEQRRRDNGKFINRSGGK